MHNNVLCTHPRTHRIRTCACILQYAWEQGVTHPHICARSVREHAHELEGTHGVEVERPGFCLGRLCERSSCRGGEPQTCVVSPSLSPSLSLPLSAAHTSSNLVVLLVRKRQGLLSSGSLEGLRIRCGVCALQDPPHERDFRKLSLCAVRFGGVAPTPTDPLTKLAV
jgi:hypothetical protein